MRRRYRWLLTALAAGVLLTGALIVTLLYTTFGLRSILLPTAARFANLDISTRELSGSLAGGFQADHVSVSTDGLRIAVDKLLLDWDFWDLLDSQVTVHELEVGAIAVHTQTPADAAEDAFELPSINLPVGIDVARADIGGVEVNGRALGALSLRQSSFTDARLAITNLTVQDANDQSATVQGSLGTVPPYAHQLQVTASAPQLGNASLTLSGSMDKGELEAAVPEQGVMLNASYSDLLGARTYEINAALSDPAPATGEVQIVSSDDAMNDALTAFTIGARMRQDGLQMTAADLHIVVQSVEMVAVTRGEIALMDPAVTARNLRGEFTSDGLQLGLDLDGIVEEQRVSGTVRAMGPWERIAATSSGTVTDLADWQLEGTVTPEALEDAHIQLSAYSGTANLRGALAWAPSLAFDWSGQIADVTLPEPINGARFSGIGGSFTAVGNEDRIEISLPELFAMIDERSVKANGDATFEGSHLTHARIDARSGSATARADLVWPMDAPLPRVDSVIDVSSLGDFVPGASGQITATVTTDEGTTTQIDANVAELRFGNMAIDTSEIRGQVELQEPYRFDASMTASGLVVNNEPLGTLSLQSAGNPEQFSTEIEAQTDARRSVDLAFDGGWIEQTLSGELTRARLGAEGLNIALTERAPFSINAESSAIDRFCLIEADRDARLCLSAAASSVQQRVTAELTSLSTQSLLEFAPLSVRDQLALEGNISGHAIAVLYPDAPSALSVSINADSLSVGHPSMRRIEGLENVQIRTSLSGDTRSTDLSVSVQSDALNASGSGEVSGWLEPPLQWNARGSLNAPSLAPFSIWLGGDTASGQLDAEIVASKPADSDVPQMEGSVRLTRLGVDVPAAETRITDGEIILEFPDARHFSLRGELPLPGGTLSASGNSEIDGDGLVNPDFRIQGKGVTLIDNAQLYLVASPNLRLQKPGDQLTVGGKVTFDSVRVLLDSLESTNIVTPSRDVIIKGDEETESQGIIADVTLDLREGASVKGRGLDATVSGSLRVQQNPGQPPRATGEMMINGTYKAYGQDLRVTDGRLIYASSPLDNPGIVMTALRTVEDVEVGVQVSGTAQEPRVELISNSGLSDVATLSYLLFGRPPDRTSVGESDSLSQAALLAALGRTSDQTQTFGQKLGLDQLSFSANSDLGGAAVSLGRYLAPNLYLGYSIGLVNGSELLELRYELTSRWTLRTEVGEESRASVRYRFIQPQRTETQDDNDS